MAALNLRDFSEWKVDMSTYQPGDYVKVEFRDDSTGESEWMWVKVEHADDEEEVVFGQLDNEPIVNKGLRRGIGGELRKGSRAQEIRGFR